VRIGIDYRPALQNREGMGRYTRELVRGMVELGFADSLGLFGYTLRGLRVPREELGIDGSGAELVRLRWPARAMPWLLERLGKGVDDLVGSCAVYHHTQPNRLPVREARQVVTVFDTIYMERVGYLDDEVAAGMERSVRDLVAHADRILVPTEFVGAEVVMTFGVWPEKVTVTGLGCDHVARALPPGELPRPAEPYVLTVSRVDARKNHLRMLRAFELLVAEGFPHRWVVAGPRGYGVETFERALSRSPARHRVEWRREVREDELPLLYAGADCFLFASLSEGFGLPPLEAMACGTPVVASCVTSMPEVLGDAAWLVEPTEHERIFEAARRILSEPALAEDHALRGKQRARRFTWRETARSTLSAYRNTLDSPAEGERPGLRRSL
jgi:glycosyltransferase involved in cell wall biosynthesis